MAVPMKLPTATRLRLSAWGACVGVAGAGSALVGSSLSTSGTFALAVCSSQCLGRVVSFGEIGRARVRLG
ncbi:hypothetical protein GCM10010431_32170 [Streptomyces kunmingensis]